MKRLALTAALALTIGCGDPTEVGLAGTVRVDSLLADVVARMSIFVLGPWRSDDIQLTCDNLMFRVIRPTDSKVEILAREDIAFTDPEGYSATLTDIEAGQNRIVYIDAHDAADAVIANGCTDTVTIESGKTAAVDVYVYCIEPPCQ
jgi:maltose-binding protein MalE